MYLLSQLSYYFDDSPLLLRGCACLNIISICMMCMLQAEPHRSFGSFADLRTGGRWFDPRPWPIFFRRIDDGHCNRIQSSLLSVVSTMVMWESSQWRGKNIVRSTGKKNSRKAWIGALPTVIKLKYC